MSPVILERFCYAPWGTFGRMTIDGATLYTVERPWLGNRPSISCIPEGTYECGPRRFFRGGYDAIELRAVPVRTHILMHIANRPTEVEGCIAINSRLGCLGGSWAGLGSRQAFAHLMEWFNSVGRSFTVSVRPLTLPEDGLR